MKKTFRLRAVLGITGILLFLGGVVPGAWAKDKSPAFQFKTRATVKGDWIRLGDIAVLRQTSTGSAADLRQLQIKEAPEPGESVIVTREEIEAALDPAAEALLLEPEAIPRGIRVVREGRELDFRELAKILESHIVKNLPDENILVEIKDIRAPEDLTVPRGRLSCKVWISEPLRRGGSFWANLVFYANGQEVKRMKVNVQVDFYQKVVVAKRYLKRHQEIQDDDLDRVPLTMKFLPPDVVTDPQTVLGKRTIQHVRGQEPIRAGMLEVPPLVKKGDIVQVIVNKQNVRVSCLGEIKETGRQGDRVKLVNLSSKKELFGRVVDGSTVVIDWN